MSYDIKCADLAEAFLAERRAQIEGDNLSAKGDYEWLKKDLSERIQETIDTFLEEKQLTR